MNLIKKIIMLSVAFTLFSVKLECMSQGALYDSTEINGQTGVRNFPPTEADTIHSLQPQTQSITNRLLPIWEIGDYLTQLG